MQEKTKHGERGARLDWAEYSATWNQSQLDDSHSSNGDSGTGPLGKGRHRFSGWAGCSNVVHIHIDLEINNQHS